MVKATKPINITQMRKQKTEESNPGLEFGRKLKMTTVLPGSSLVSARNSTHKGSLQARKAVPYRLRIAMAYHDLSARELVRRSRVMEVPISPAAVSNHLNGQTLPNDAALASYMRVLKITSEWIYGEVDLSECNIPPEFLHEAAQRFHAQGLRAKLRIDKNIEERVGKVVTIPDDNQLSYFRRSWATEQQDEWQGTGLNARAYRARGDIDFLAETRRRRVREVKSHKARSILADRITQRVIFLCPTIDWGEMAGAIAKATGLNTSTIYNILGKRSYPGSTTLILIAVALKMPVEVLEEGIVTPPADSIALSPGKLGQRYRAEHPDVDRLAEVDENAAFLLSQTEIPFGDPFDHPEGYGLIIQWVFDAQKHYLTKLARAIAREGTPYNGMLLESFMEKWYAFKWNGNQTISEDLHEKLLYGFAYRLTVEDQRIDQFIQEEDERTTARIKAKLDWDEHEDYQDAVNKQMMRPHPLYVDPTYSAEEIDQFFPEDQVGDSMVNATWWVRGIPWELPY
jgi:transcriptional regulator with XRE-family HTH domain